MKLTGLLYLLNKPNKRSDLGSVLSIFPSIIEYMKARPVTFKVQNLKLGPTKKIKNQLQFKKASCSLEQLLVQLQNKFILINKLETG